jgi:hypothetical protein
LPIQGPLIKNKFNECMLDEDDVKKLPLPPISATPMNTQVFEKTI